MSNDNLIVNNNDENELAHQNFQSPEVVKCMENAALFNNVIKDKYKTSNKINIFGENKQSNNNTMFNVFNTVNQVNLGLAKQNNFDTKTENKDKLCDSSLLKNEKIFNINKSKNIFSFLSTSISKIILIKIHFNLSLFIAYQCSIKILNNFFNNKLKFPL